MYKSLSTKGKRYSGKICRPRGTSGLFRGILPVAYRRICNGFLAFWLSVFAMAWDKCLYMVVDGFRYLTIILWNHVEYRLIFSRRGDIVLLFNTLITKHSFLAEKKLETIFILPFFSPTHEISYIAGYLLTTDDEYSMHHDLGSLSMCWCTFTNRKAWRTTILSIL